jgi:hypothetical protein
VKGWRDTQVEGRGKSDIKAELGAQLLFVSNVKSVGHDLLINRTTLIFQF